MCSNVVRETWLQQSWPRIGQSYRARGHAKLLPLLEVPACPRDTLSNSITLLDAATRAVWGNFSVTQARLSRVCMLPHATQGTTYLPVVLQEADLRAVRLLEGALWILVPVNVIHPVGLVIVPVGIQDMGSKSSNTFPEPWRCLMLEGQGKGLNDGWK